MQKAATPQELKGKIIIRSKKTHPLVVKTKGSSSKRELTNSPKRPKRKLVMIKEEEDDEETKPNEPRKL